MTADDDDMLEQAEGLDSDEVRNDDGDQVADPPDQWIAPDDNDSLDDKLAAEVPDELLGDGVSKEAHDAGSGGALGLVSEDDLEQMDPAGHGSGSEQIDGTPEDGDSFFNVAE
jgi:hypothetical protein